MNELHQSQLATEAKTPSEPLWLRLGKLSIAERPDGETYVLESEAIALINRRTVSPEVIEAAWRVVRATRFVPREQATRDLEVILRSLAPVMSKTP